ncbi:ATP-binding protein [Actinocorallia longicatena]|uniref:Anti-sigma regulatory factor n=1 Tax=Actinocorallia longicatena TaxID=111803 RepID=A0ABP6QBR4_9ACTN
MGALSAGWTTQGDSTWVAVEEASAAAGIRRRVATLAERLGFRQERVAEIQLAVTEAATNLHRHAQGGEMALRTVRDGESLALEVVCLDRGPGIADVGRSLRDGHSTGGTLGVGLGTIFRLADSADLHSVPSGGTVLALRFTTGAPALWRSAGLTRAISGEEECGDAFIVGRVDGVLQAMLCDGLGHGPLAARASAEAVRAFHEAGRPADPSTLVRALHARLSGTRGGAVAVVSIEGTKVTFAGLGNVAGWIVGDERRQGMVSTPGIAGHQARTLREYRYELPPGGVVVLHSDGLTDRWRPQDQPGLFRRDPLVIAGALMRDAGIRHDDRAVLVLGRED